MKGMYLAKDLGKSEKVSTRDGYGKGLLEAGKNKDVVALCADLEESTRSSWFKEEFPERFFEVGVAEQNMIGIAAGLALNGKIPFVHSFAVFSPARNWDQLRISVCYSNANVKIQGCHAGITVGKDGASHQALEDIAITRVLPNMTVVVPCDAIEAEKSVLESLKIDGPVYIRVGREKFPLITSKRTPFKIGKASVFREGSDVTIIACGIMVGEALKAAAALEKKKISAEVINCHTIKPLDEKTIVNSAKKTGKAITAEEHQIIGGLGSAISELLSENYPVPIRRIGISDTFGESGEPIKLMEKYHITSRDIVNAAMEMIKGGE